MLMNQNQQPLPQQAQFSQKSNFGKMGGAANMTFAEPDPSSINFYGGANAGAHQPSAQGMRLNTKSPGRSTNANNFAPMTYGAAAMKQNQQQNNHHHHLANNSVGESYNYSIPSDNTFYPMMHGGGNGGQGQNNFNSASATNY